MGKVNRTIVCSVVFIDIVGYSKKSVDEQLSIKEHFNGITSAATKLVDYEDRILLDTGDGAAMCFLSDPEDAFHAAMTVQNGIFEHNEKSGTPYTVRIGINLGPIKAIKDINGKLNTVGDGINVAQRIMDFAQPNQILVSRSYYDVIWNLSNDYANLFRYHGLHKDKHIREHTVFEVVSKDRGDLEQISEMDGLLKVVEQESAVQDNIAALSDLLGGNEKAGGSEPPAAKAREWDPDLLKSLENSLARYLGPIATALVMKLSKHAADLRELRQALADEINSEEEKRLFIAEVGKLKE